MLSRHDTQAHRIAGLTAARSGLPALWWVAIIALAVCMPFFFFTIVTRAFFLGPDVAELYAQHIDGSALQAGIGLLTELERDMSRTRRGVVVKELAFMLGLYLFVLGALFSAAFLARIAVVR